jgi:Terminase RNaseH-like domain
MKIEIDPRLEAYARVIKGLHVNFIPHPKQVVIGRALLTHGVKDIFVEAGRNFGKTALVSYLLWRWAALNPGTENYYFAPYMKQAREIVWSPRILPEFGPADWLSNKQDNEMRLTFTNGSFIKADGSDNVNAYRGVKPRGLIVFDEFKDFRPEFYEAFDPNRGAHGAPIIIIGTPPQKECQFTKVRDAYKHDSTKRYFHATSRENPHISKEWLDAKEKELTDRGEYDVWQREYMALQVASGSTKIFPMLDRTKHIVPHETIMQRIARDRKRIEWIWFADPAAASTFGVLFVAYNPYSKELFLLDEIYETDQSRMTVKVMGQEIIKKRDELHIREWRQGYDEAATWFQNEMLDNFDEHMEPSMKASNDKESGITLIKDILLQGKLMISERCIKTFWEMDNYFKDRNGEIPKRDDHLVDCLRYVLAALYYSLPTVGAPEEPNRENRTRIEDDFPNMKGTQWI